MLGVQEVRGIEINNKKEGHQVKGIHIKIVISISHFQNRFIVALYHKIIICNFQPNNVALKPKIKNVF